MYRLVWRMSEASSRLMGAPALALRLAWPGSAPSINRVETASPAERWPVSSPFDVWFAGSVGV